MPLFFFFFGGTPEIKSTVPLKARPGNMKYKFCDNFSNTKITNNIVW